MYANDTYYYSTKSFAHDSGVVDAWQALTAYRRASVLRWLVTGAVLVLATLRAVYLYVGTAEDTLLNSPPVWGFTLLVTFFTFTLEWSTRTQCQQALCHCKTADNQVLSS